MPQAKVDNIAPPFELPASNGEKISSWQFKGRSALVLFFSHAACSACEHFLTRLESEGERFRERQAQVLALLPLPVAGCRELAEKLQLSYPLLADTEEKVRALYLRERNEVGVLVLDRYGEPYGRWAAPEADQLPATEAALEALSLCELECPECGVPEWS